MEGKGGETMRGDAATEATSTDYDPFSGWDSADDDFEDYFGIGCTRDLQPKREATPTRPDCYSIRLSDGSMTTVDIGAARRRLLGLGENYLSTATVPVPQSGKEEVSSLCTQMLGWIDDVGKHV
jgi:hypothetical protein